MFNYTRIVIFAFILIVLPPFLYSTIINIPADYATIQAGIDAAVSTDTVLVQPGTYVENINFSSSHITLGSLFLTTQNPSYVSSTIIDGNASGSVVSIVNASYIVLCGFTITNGSATDGGGFYCKSAGVNLENMIITDNTATDYGGGIFCYESYLISENVTIINNSATIRGGGISLYEYIYESTVRMYNTTISNNDASNGGGAHSDYYTDLYLYDSTISENSAVNGGGVYFQGEDF
ncbi:MAG: hypothetical protein GQ534_01850, partial [Candidatus Delongbacteria bacterium]|nr:hypothetical protein [Candidatus Delongbacteria bacterium]